ncbi:MAG: aldo/keto reductase, partial [Gammaproteobacteria bacterium]
TQKKLINFCKQHDIAVTAYGPLGSPHRPWRDESSPVILEDKTVKEIALVHQKFPAQILLRFAMQRDLIALTRSTNIERIKQNGDIFDFHLTEDEMTALFKLNRNFRGMSYRAQWKHPDHPFREGIDG